MWYALIVIVLTSLFIEQLFAFNIMDALSWARLILFTCLLISSFFVYPFFSETSSEKAYTNHLERKNHEIKELQKKNGILMQTAMKQAKKTYEISMLAKKITKNQK